MLKETIDSILYNYLKSVYKLQVLVLTGDFILLRLSMLDFSFPKV